MSLPAPIAAMLRPEVYPNRPPEVRLVQTHISYVLLAGSSVYKIKKPVRFSFLDFSTLERRRHFCHEEVRLNRRLAPDVYIGVVTICKDGPAYRLGADDDPAAVECAVHMRRLPEDRTMDRLLERNAVTSEMIEQVAVRMVQFHRNADAGPEVTANGDPAAIACVLEDNFAGMRPFRDVTVSAADDDAIQAFSRNFLRRRVPLFHRRQADRRIRDCHGDLHAEHLCFDTQLVIFDCIEFNAQFRYCDVASEMAFLAMDLEYHDHPELAAHLVTTYAKRSGDADLPQLVPFYKCYRAYVRGKVDSLKSAEPEVGDDERQQARASAGRHFALAYRYTWAYSPALVLVTGLSGTGKSVLAAALQQRTGFSHLSSDVIRKRLAGIPAGVHPRAAYESGLYTVEHSALTYRQLLAEAAACLGQGEGAILDATFQRRADRAAGHALAKRRGVPMVIVECRCSEDVVRERLQRRADSREGPSDADWSIYLEQRRRFEPFAADEESEHLTVDTAQSVDNLIAAIEPALRRKFEV
jgi:uncharacterized protein